MEFTAWKNFNDGKWQTEINVADFIKTNYEPYYGDSQFLRGATDRTNALMDKVNALLKLEREKGGVLDVDVEKVSSLLSYDAGYIDKDSEIIVGLQTDAPLKRGVNPVG
jgi:formate C-acetyltransferase